MLPDLLAAAIRVEPLIGVVWVLCLLLDVWLIRRTVNHGRAK